MKKRNSKNEREAYETMVKVYAAAHKILIDALADNKIDESLFKSVNRQIRDACDILKKEENQNA